MTAEKQQTRERDSDRDEHHRADDEVPTRDIVGTQGLRDPVRDRLRILHRVHVSGSPCVLI
jgi:hypothetical protein